MACRSCVPVHCQHPPAWQCAGSRRVSTATSWLAALTKADSLEKSKNSIAEETSSFDRTAAVRTALGMVMTSSSGLESSDSSSREMLIAAGESGAPSTTRSCGVIIDLPGTGSPRAYFTDKEAHGFASLVLKLAIAAGDARQARLTHSSHPVPGGRQSFRYLLRR